MDHGSGGESHRTVGTARDIPSTRDVNRHGVREDETDGEDPRPGTSRYPHGLGTCGVSEVGLLMRASLNPTLTNQMTVRTVTTSPRTSNPGTKERIPTIPTAPPRYPIRLLKIGLLSMIKPISRLATLELRLSMKLAA